ncbi:hydroxyacylglutathione hydrolase [Glaciecola sp. SC05]|uniref:hydroxyacylglutathione hydrolase n=1 Tax=Glaciecola sp. SC05 TaxID=1987355 RepID=UPI00352991B6
MSQSINITAIKAFNDNYIWCIHDNEHAVVVDPGDAVPVQAFLTDRGLQLSEILITHHHYDHTGGIAALKQDYPSIPVIGPENKVIKGLTEHVSEGDKVSVLKQQVSLSILQTPGHTLDHIVFYNSAWLFCGDTLFSAGCGRMFEGTPEVFLTSLDKLSKLPADTQVYCTHEYTLANLKFARYLLPNHASLQEYETWAQQQRAHEQITLPSTIAQQRKINPFLQCHDKQFQADMENKLQQTLANAVDTFAAIRAAKDNF